MILKILIIIFIIIIFYLIINYNYEYFIDNSRNTNEYSWERNEINSSLPYDIKLKNKESNLYDYGNDELLNVKFRFVIKPEDINLLCQDIKKEEDGK